VYYCLLLTYNVTQKLKKKKNLSNFVFALIVISLMMVM